MDNEENYSKMSQEELEEMISGIYKMGENRRFTEENLPLLKALYPNQWVAISNGKVLGPCSELDDMWPLLEEQGIDRKASLVTFLSPNPHTLIL